MTGTLHKTEKGWVVRYWDRDPHYNGPIGTFKQIIFETEVSNISLTNPDLSTYWVEGREVEFIKNFLPRMDTNEDVFIIPEDETWDDILKNVCDQDLTNINDIWNWLKQKYEAPKRK